MSRPKSFLKLNNNLDVAFGTTNEEYDSNGPLTSVTLHRLLLAFECPTLHEKRLYAAKGINSTVNVIPLPSYEPTTPSLALVYLVCSTPVLRILRETGGPFYCSGTSNNYSEGLFSTN